MSGLFQENSTQVVLVPQQFDCEDSFLSPLAKAKVLAKQINWVFTHRKTEYLGEILNLCHHKSVSIRRKIASGLGTIAGKEVLPKIQEWQKVEPDRQTWLILETLIDKLNRCLDTQKQTNIKVLTVSEALMYIKKLLGENTYTIEGELSEVRPSRNIYYFAIKDKREARLTCWAFEKVIERINFPLNEGLQVRLTGKFKISKDSRLYFETIYIKLTGEGELLRNLKMLEQKLTQEGLFDPARKRQIPKIPQKILLIASPNSAALTDFIKVLDSRRSGLEIFLLPIKTQGVGAEAVILGQLAKVNQLCQDLQIDTVVITRGGGSQDDLFVFNSEAVVRAIHGINRPTIVAIGHERDTTLSELVADLRCSTPSQAAEKVSQTNSEIIHQATSSVDFIKNFCLQKIQQYYNFCWQVSINIQNLTRLRIDQIKQICNQTNQIATQIISQARFETTKTFFSCKQLVNFELQRIKNTYQQLYPKIFEQVELKISNFRRRFDLVTSQIWLHDPKNILSKGYAIIIQDGTVREKIKNINRSRPVTIQMQDGQLDINVQKS